MVTFWEIGPVAEAGLPADLAELIDRSDRLVVKDTGFPEAHALFTSTHPADRLALKRALKLRFPAGGVVCGCTGSPVIFFEARGQRIGSLAIHHMSLVSSELWDTSVYLQDTTALLHWLDARGIDQPRQDLAAAKQACAEHDRNRLRWIAAMPVSLKGQADQVLERVDLGAAYSRRRLQTEIPSTPARIRALLGWFGSGAGPWSGYYAYEDIPADLLAEYPEAEIYAAAAGPLTAAQSEGLARYLAVKHLFNADSPPIPADLKARLLAHSLTSADADKRERAAAVFGR